MASEEVNAVKFTPFRFCSFYLDCPSIVIDMRATRFIPRVSITFLFFFNRVASCGVVAFLEKWIQKWTSLMLPLDLIKECGRRTLL